MAKLPSLRSALLVKPGAKVDLAKFDTGATFGRTKETAPATLEANGERLRDLQERLWAEGKRRVLIVLQGIDTAGKGGTIEHVMGFFNPAGVDITSFKVPTPLELAHDFLWRVHQRVPANGEIMIFDRSHYEDVLVVRVNDIVPKAVWSARYAQINEFERVLADTGTTIVKFCLLISSDEQRERLQARLDDPDKRWKFRLGDLKVRDQWADYQAAYQEVLRRCSPATAPWYTIPSDRKWFRNLAVSEILVDTLAELDPQFPPPPEELPPDLKVE
jgi:PPK2 family polyphosphate:nucleotide phosphotransferase